MFNQIAIATAGFSIIALALLYFQKRTETRIAIVIGRALIVDLALLQFLHVGYVLNVWQFTSLLAFVYLLSLGLVGPLFYLYSQNITLLKDEWLKKDYRHLLLPVIFATAGASFSEFFMQAYGLMFLLGGFYMVRLGSLLFSLREKRTLFKLEFTLTTLFLAWAFCIIVIGLLVPLPMADMVVLQTIMLALVIAIALHIQLNFPHLLSTLEEAAERRYQTSTLANIDCDRVKADLSNLMTEKKVYEDSALSLVSLAEMLSIKSHQLSEFINTHMGMGFASYLRQCRVDAAEQLLKSEPDASVLAIGLSVGFNSQSAFYSAFKEIHGIAPGQYRRKLLPDL